MSGEAQEQVSEEPPAAAAGVTAALQAAALNDSGLIIDSHVDENRKPQISSEISGENLNASAATEPATTSPEDSAAAGAERNGAHCAAASPSTEVPGGKSDRTESGENGAKRLNLKADEEEKTGASISAAPDSTPDQPADSTAKERLVPYAFSGMQCVLDKSKSPVCALSFGRLDSALLAFGADDGTVRIASISEQRASILHEMREHKKRVTDLDWSLQNDQLLTSAEDGSVCLSSSDDGIWSMARKFETSTGATACLFHPVNQNLIIVGTAAGSIDVFNSSTGLQLEACRAQLTSNQPEGVSVACMDVSRDVLYVGDSAGYIHALRLELDKRGALMPPSLLARIPPPGNKLACLASLSYTAYAACLKGPALLTAGTDDLVCIYRVIAEKAGKVRLELASKHLMPQTARPVKAALCPTLPSAEPEYVAMGGEDTSVNVYDVSDTGKAPVPVVRLQGHCAPVVAVAWAFDERRLASSDCDGTVIVWKREHAKTEPQDETPY